MNSINLAEENFAFEKSAEFVAGLWTVLNGQWFRKNYFNHCLTEWNSFQRLLIDVRADREESEFQTSVPCHVRIWSKWRHILSLFWWTETSWSLHRMWSDTTYLRDKKWKRNVKVTFQEIASWNVKWRRNRRTSKTRIAILSLIFTDKS